MSNANYVSGEVSWEDTKVFDGKNAGKKDEWMRLDKGENIVRILTLPHQYYQHRVVIPGGAKYGYRINCSTTKESGCPICEQGDNKASRRWLLGVIDRKTGLYKILDIGYGIFKAIKTIRDDSDWGDPTAFDINIVNSGEGAQRYSCVCKPKRPLSATDLALQAEHGTETLVFRSTPPTYEKVEERLDRIKEDIAKQNGGTNGSSNDLSEEENEDQEFFVDYDKVKTKKTA